MARGLPPETLLHARRTVGAVLYPTRLIHSGSLSELTDAQVWLKLECQQPTGSFKVRGAINKISGLRAAGLPAGLVTGSAGNHGLGVAFAAQQLGVGPVTIFVPGSAPRPKLQKLARFAVDVIKVGSTYEQAHQAAETFARERGAAYVPAYDDLEIIAGQATAGLELMLDMPELEQVIVPIGGGGLIAGIASAVKALRPGMTVTGVQAAASPAAVLSLEQGRAIDPYDHEPTIADGLAGGFGAVPYEVAGSLIDDIELASEGQLREAIYFLLTQEQIVVEASGAAAIVPLLRTPGAFAGRTLACVLSGANLDPGLLHDIVLGQSKAGK